MTGFKRESMLPQNALFTELTMKATVRISVAFLSIILAAGCAGPSQPISTAGLPTPRPPRPPSQLPSLESHLTNDWISAATRIQCGESAIYYRGAAQRDSAEDEAWTGTVHGDILFLSPQRAILIPSGTLTLTPGNHIKVVGASNTVLARPTEKPKWRQWLTT
jgi:hypothetical protein